MQAHEPLSLSSPASFIPRALRLFLVGSAAVIGCGPESVDTGTTAPVSGTNPPLMSTTDPADTVAVTSTTSTSTTSGTTTPVDPCGQVLPDGSMERCSGGVDSSTSCTFLGCTTGDPDPCQVSPDGLMLRCSSCDPFLQDCGEGFKCSAVINDGGGSWNGVKCVPVGGSGQPGDSCIAESSAQGLDDCDKGVMCWDVNDMGMGTCVKLCEGTAEAPICEGGTLCTIANDGSLNLCLPTCSPLLQDCPEGNACYPINDSFACAPDASGDTGVANDPCEFINVCEAGLMCANAEFVGAGCPQGSMGCCTPFCDLTDPAECPNPDQSCVEFFDPMNIPIFPPDAADIGVCGIPG